MPRDVIIFAQKKYRDVIRSLAFPAAAAAAAVPSAVFLRRRGESSMRRVVHAVCWPSLSPHGSARISGSITRPYLAMALRIMPGR